MILVAYFSAGGVTARAAKEIAKETGGDLFEILPETPYSRKDLDWTDRRSRSSEEMADPSSRPRMKGSADTAPYDTIFLGFPIWWYIEPRIIDTFLDGADIKGKRIIPFATSGGSPVTKASEHLMSLYPEAIWEKGSLVLPNNAAAWAKDAL